VGCSHLRAKSGHCDEEAVVKWEQLEESVAKVEDMSRDARLRKHSGGRGIGEKNRKVAEGFGVWEFLEAHGKLMNGGTCIVGLSAQHGP
jgi:hypothetical protein